MKKYKVIYWREEPHGGFEIMIKIRATSIISATEKAEKIRDMRDMLLYVDEEGN